MYSSISNAKEAKQIIIELGINNGFVTPYYNGKRITFNQAKTYEEQGTQLVSSPTLDLMPYVNQPSKYGSTQPIKKVVPVSNSGTPSATTPPATSINDNTIDESTNNSVSEVVTTTETTGVSEAESDGTGFDNTNAEEDGVIVYKVQIGAYKYEVPIKVANIFFQLASKGIDNYKNEDGLTVYTVGSYDNIEDAEALKDELRIKYGLEDAYVVVHKNGKRVSLQEVR